MGSDDLGREWIEKNCDKSMKGSDKFIFTPTLEANGLDPHDKGECIDDKASQLVIGFPSPLLSQIALHLGLRNRGDFGASRGRSQTTICHYPPVNMACALNHTSKGGPCSCLPCAHLPGLFFTEPALEVEDDL